MVQGLVELMLLHNVEQHNANVTRRYVTKRSCTQRKFRNVKFSKPKLHITHSVTKCIPLQNVKCTMHKHYKTYVWFVTLYVMWRSHFDTFMFCMLTLCASMLCSNTVESGLLHLDFSMVAKSLGWENGKMASSLPLLFNWGSLRLSGNILFFILSTKKKIWRDWNSSSFRF
jgi:hypothetical protein